MSEIYPADPGKAMVCTKADSELKSRDEGTFFTIFKDTLQLYQETASIHGVSRTLQPQLYTCRRLLWGILVGIMSVLLALTLSNLVSELHERPIKTVNKITLYDELPFPAVTVCNLNQFVSDRIPDNPTLRHVLFAKSEYASLTGVNASMQDLDNMTYVSGEELRRVTLNAAPRLNELLVTCAWKTQDVDCRELFQPVNTTYGLCYMFNGDKHNVRVASMSSFRDGLLIRMNVGNRGGYFSQYMEAGVMLLINQHGAPLMPQSEGLTLRPGVSARIKLTRQDNIRLPYPYKAFSNSYCEDTAAESHVNRLTHHSVYSSLACQLECFDAYITKNCGCRGFNHGVPSESGQICSAKDYLTCHVPKSAQFKQSDMMACDCREECEVTTYETEVFYADFASRFIHEQTILDNNLYAHHFETSAIEATIFFKSLKIQRLEQQPAISMSEVIGKLGGQMGLFLGVSLLSYAEIVEMLFLLALNYFKACKRCLSCKMRASSTKANISQVSQTPVSGQADAVLDPLEKLPGGKQ